MDDPSRVRREDAPSGHGDDRERLRDAPNVPRFTLGRMMLGVAIMAAVLGFASHVHNLTTDFEEDAWKVLFIEGGAATILLAFALGIGFVVRFVRRDDAYALRLNRNGVPARLDWVSSLPDPRDAG